MIELAWSIRETWQALVSGFYLGRAEHFEKRGKISKMQKSANRALHWAKTPISKVGAHIINAKAEELAGQNTVVKDHLLAARECIEDNPAIRDYRELRGLLSELNRLETTFFAGRND